MGIGSRKIYSTEELDELSPKRISSRRITIGIGVPMSLLNVIDRIGESEGVPQTTLIERLLRKGLAVERDEREAKHKAEGD